MAFRASVQFRKEDHFCPGGGANLSIVCPNGTYSFPGSDIERDCFCPAFSSSERNSSKVFECMCNAGYYQVFNASVEAVGWQCEVIPACAGVCWRLLACARHCLILPDGRCASPETTASMTPTSRARPSPRRGRTRARSWSARATPATTMPARRRPPRCASSAPPRRTARAAGASSPARPTLTRPRSRPGAPAARATSATRAWTTSRACRAPRPTYATAGCRPAARWGARARRSRGPS